MFFIVQVIPMIQTQWWFNNICSLFGVYLNSTTSRLWLTGDATNLRSGPGLVTKMIASVSQQLTKIKHIWSCQKKLKMVPFNLFSIFDKLQVKTQFYFLWQKLLHHACYIFVNVMWSMDSLFPMLMWWFLYLNI